MIRLSSGYTSWYRFFGPLSTLIVCGVLINQHSEMGTGPFEFALVAGVGLSLWFGWRLSDVWVDGDELVVKGLKSFRVPLADLSLDEMGSSSWWMARGPTVFVLGLNPPIGMIQKIRFMPANGSIGRELQARIHAARAARAAK